MPVAVGGWCRSSLQHVQDDDVGIWFVIGVDDEKQSDQSYCNDVVEAGVEVVVADAGRVKVHRN
jgi:hypothetical protein